MVKVVSEAFGMSAWKRSKGREDNIDKEMDLSLSFRIVVF
jgi:peroxiredoxin